MPRAVPPWGMVLGGAASTQFGAALGATLFDDLGPAGAALLRLGFAAIVLLVVWRPSVRGRPRGDLRLAVVFGLTLGVMNLSFYEAIDRIPLGVAVTIEFAGPLGVAVFASRRRSDLGWAALAGAGIVLLAGRTGAGGVDALGLALVSLAGLCWAAYIVLNQRAGQRFSGVEGLALAAPVAALVPLGPGIAQGGGDLLDPRLLALGLAVGVASSVIPYSLETVALRRMAVSVFGVLMSLDPVIAALAGFVVLSQSLGARDLVAIVMVVTASVGITRSSTGPAPLDGA